MHPIAMGIGVTLAGFCFKALHGAIILHNSPENQLFNYSSVDDVSSGYRKFVMVLYLIGIAAGLSLFFWGLG